MTPFQQALPFVLHAEGGYVNHPNDPAGATNRGITQQTYDAYRRNRNLLVRGVQAITEREVEDIYHRYYWRPARCDDVGRIAPNVGRIHFDCAVNCGVLRAARMLQTCLSVRVDGIIGPITLAAIADTPEPELVLRYLNARAMYYRNLAAAKPSLNVFLRGWLNRLRHLAASLTPPLAYEV